MAFNPPPDVHLNWEGRLHAAMDLLKRARADVAHPEDDPQAQRLQHVALLHIDAALHAADRAMHAVRRYDDKRE